MRFLRAFAAGLGVVVLLASAAVMGVLYLTLPAARLAAVVPGLSAAVAVTFDQDGVARISAATAEDAAAALGFVHARDRMFEMELMRRAAAGRLSEIAGPATLNYDRMMRTLGLRQLAVADLAALAPRTRALLEAYSRGVNAWIGLKGRFAAAEFLAFGAPEPWGPVDCLLWGKTMGLWLSGNYRTELARQGLAKTLTPAQIEALWPRDGSGGHPEQAWLDGVPGMFAGLEKVLPAFPAPFTLPATASNEWAVDGRRSASGAPLLAGDPHLGFGQPGIWYLARIATPLGVLAGATAPGVPFMVLGHNGHIAWTFTSTEADVQDLFVETVSDAGHYLGPDGPLPFGMREERIRVRGQDDVVMTVRTTRHGPVISDLAPPGGGGSVLALAAANLQPGDTAADGLLALDMAGSVAEAGRSAPEISSPVQNLLVADRNGIGLFVTGRVPIRRAGDGAMPVAGADGGHDWVGFASGTQLPQVVAPASGLLVNGNERIAPEDFPVFLGRDWFGDWRAQRIRAMLGTRDHLTVSDFAAMQLDVKSVFADRVLPVLRDVVPAVGQARQAAALVAGWDGTMARERPEPLIFNAWMRQFFADVLARNGIRPNAATPQLEFLASVLTPGGSSWCGGDCRAMLLAALEAAVGELATRFGDDPGAWRWGEAHQAVFANPVLQGIPLLGGLSTARIAAPGDDGTVDRGTTAPDNFDGVHGASFRAAYDLADLDASRFVMAPGQSGNPISSHARDFIERWRNGDTVTLAPEAARVTATLALSPP